MPVEREHIIISNVYCKKINVTFKLKGCHCRRRGAFPDFQVKRELSFYTWTFNAERENVLDTIGWSVKETRKNWICHSFLLALAINSIKKKNWKIDPSCRWIRSNGSLPSGPMNWDIFYSREAESGRQHSINYHDKITQWTKDTFKFHVGWAVIWLRRNERWTLEREKKIDTRSTVWLGRKDIDNLSNETSHTESSKLLNSFIVDGFSPTLTHIFHVSMIYIYDSMVSRVVEPLPFSPYSDAWQA